jgi:two-component system nitrogen regulation sensor histidine kinase NtrY
MRQTLRQWLVWAQRLGLARKLAIGLAGAALVSGSATYVALREGLDGEFDLASIRSLLYLDAALVLLLSGVVGRRILLLWSERRSGGAGSRLHGRLVSLFSLVAVAPTILVAIFSGLFLHLGVEAWFTERVRTVLHESIEVASAYLKEHQERIQQEAYIMARSLDMEAFNLARNPQLLTQAVSAQARVRRFDEALVFERADGIMRVTARSQFSMLLELAVPSLPVWALELAEHGDVALLSSDNDDRVRALVRLNNFPDSYLYVGYYVDPKVIRHQQETSEAVAELERLEGRSSGLEITFSIIFVMVAALLLLAAIWVGLSLATRMARPIIQLIDAAAKVGGGDLEARVPEPEAVGELASLSRAFNQMTLQLQSQQRALIDANRELDERRRFTETVLSGVSAGVIGLDGQGRVHLPNRSASDLLGIDLDGMLGQPLSDVVPEMAELCEAARRRPDRLLQGEIRLVHDHGIRTLLVRIAPEQVEDEVAGYVVTFDDVTQLLSAQRKAAWADVARRIAHEIKNPLTPIQLSAERLKRKYLKEINSDKDTFVTCTDTIIRQVGDIGRMVDEFSAFARMPAPVMDRHDLRELVRQALFLQRNGAPDVTFDGDLPDEPVMLYCDSRQVGQALTNILKNAVESIQGRDGGAGDPGHISLRLYGQAGQVVVDIADNGKGLPLELRDRLTEPYVTTRAKGTGLGLAIVKKIMEDHNGDLQLDDLAGRGARVRLIFDAAAHPAGDAPVEATTHGA